MAPFAASDIRLKRALHGEKPRGREDASAAEVTNRNGACQRWPRPIHVDMGRSRDDARRIALGRERWGNAARHPQAMSTVWGTRKRTSGSVDNKGLRPAWSDFATVDNARFRRLVAGRYPSIYSPLTGAPPVTSSTGLGGAPERSPRGENGKTIVLHSCGYHCGEPLGSVRGSEGGRGGTSRGRGLGAVPADTAWSRHARHVAGLAGEFDPLAQR